MAAIDGVTMLCDSLKNSGKKFIGDFARSFEIVSRFVSRVIFAELILSRLLRAWRVCYAPPVPLAIK